ncbi:tetratricopeptide repeat protein [Kitasatospora sp. RG8]|uniref:tetratricopeptide repeat protein n=1 Tax=Kitasatospora sp. RG8 TaxID=2820815 RepID=UPI001ADF773B|nr:tetratricopeptide repeat protein [Kitasatospora sp. RG8]MBP0455714.1 tetratricopeptide repeat protein [Kitasatospora sp. RG8]
MSGDAIPWPTAEPDAPGQARGSPAPQRYVVRGSDWDLLGTSLSQILADLAGLREALAEGDAQRAAGGASRLLPQLDGRTAWLSTVGGHDRAQPIRACVLTCLARAQRLAGAGTPTERFTEAVAIFDRLARSGVTLKPAELSDYGIALAELGRTGEAAGTVRRALAEQALVPPEVVLRLAHGPAEESDEPAVQYLLGLALDAGTDDARLTEMLARSRAVTSPPEQASDTYVLAGVQYGATGLLENARRCFAKALALVPGRPEAQVGEGMALAGLGRLAEGDERLTRALGRHPEHRAAQSATAQLRAALGRPDEALHLLAKWLEKAPGDPVLLDARARVLIAARRWEPALDAVDRVLAASPDQAEARRLKALVLRAQDDQEGAISLLRELLAEGAATFDDRLDMIDAMTDAGDHQRALAETDHALLFHPGNTDLLAFRAILLGRLDRTTEAFGPARAALDRDPGNVRALELVAAALADEGETDEAIKLLRRRQTLDPPAPSVALRLSDLLWSAGDRPGAVDTLSEALAAEPDTPELLLRRGQLLTMQGAATEGLADLRRVLAMADPEWPEEAHQTLHAALGEAYRNLPEPDHLRALAHLDQALEVDKSDAWVLGTKGQVLAALGDPAAADLLTQAVDLDPTLTWAMFDLAELLRTDGRLAAALDMSTRVTEQTPENAQAWGNRGAVEYALDDFDTALGSLNQALKLDPEYAWAWIVTAHLLGDIDRNEDADLAFDRGLGLDPDYPWAWTRKAWLLRERDLLADAAASFRQALERDPDDNLARIGEADLLMMDKRSEDARRAFTGIAAQLRGADGLELAQLGWCHLRLGEYLSAAREFGDALLLDGDMDSSRTDLALSLLGTGAARRAVNSYAEAVARINRHQHPGKRSSLRRMAAHDLVTVLGQPGFPAPDTEPLEEIRWLLSEEGPTSAEWRHGMILTPARYVCSEHDRVLTAEVEEKVSGLTDVTVNFAFGRLRKKRPQPFQVVVKCQGNEADPRIADPHDVEFEGSVS